MSLRIPLTGEPLGVWKVALFVTLKVELGLAG
jgi:hypothetical protein